MERIYYPSLKRVILFIYVVPAIVWGVGFGSAIIVSLARGEQTINFNWVAFTSFWIAWIGLRVLSDGLRAERLAIKIASTAISGPIAVGKAEPISFDEIDYQKTLNQSVLAKIFLSRRVHSLSGDQISIHELLFEPQQLAEIWSIVKNAEHRQGS